MKEAKRKKDMLARVAEKKASISNAMEKWKVHKTQSFSMDDEPSGKLLMVTCLALFK